MSIKYERVNQKEENTPVHCPEVGDVDEEASSFEPFEVELALPSATRLFVTTKRYKIFACVCIVVLAITFIAISPPFDKPPFDKPQQDFDVGLTAAMFQRKRVQACGALTVSPIECNRHLSAATIIPPTAHPFFLNQAKAEPGCSVDIVYKLSSTKMNWEDAAIDLETASFRDILACATSMCRQFDCVAFFHRLGKQMGAKSGGGDGIILSDITAFKWHPWLAPIVHGFTSLRVSDEFVGEADVDAESMKAAISAIVADEGLMEMR